MISVVHIYPKTNSMIANYVSMLTKAMGNHVDNRITDDPGALKEICLTQSPDIIHQHGHVNYALPKGIQARKVVTLHGEKPTNLQDSYVVIARSQMEFDSCDAPRLELLRNPIITKTVTFDGIAEKMVSIYQKVMQTNVLPLMSDDTRKALHLLLKAGVCGDSRWLEDKTIPSTIEWDKLHIVAFFEHVDMLVSRGAKIMGIDMPASTVRMSTSYLPAHYKIPEETSDIQVIPLLEKIAKGDICLLRMAEMYMALTDPNLDEEELLIKLEQKKQIPLMQSILQILKETFYLTEGFMPCMPIDNHETQRIRNRLTNHLAL